jgi:succinyldiaminopimelate transaminase
MSTGRWGTLGGAWTASSVAPVHLRVRGRRCVLATHHPSHPIDVVIILKVTLYPLGLTVAISPVLRRQTVYPFVRLEEAKRRVAALGVEILDFGVGDPRGRAEPFIREALVAALEETSGYPLAQGLPELRGAIADWCARRFGARLDPDTQVIPTLGSKEAIFSFAQVVVDPDGDRDTVVVTEPGYPVPERGGLTAGARVERLPLRAPDFLPDLDAIADETWERLALFWVNYPNNPTGAVAPLAFYEQLADRAREHGFVLASDEAYSELWFDEPPASALQLGELANVVSFNTLSKRSSMTGYRSGFVAGDPRLIDALKTFRPTVGTAPQEFVQRASVVAWGDEAHVERNRAVYAARRELFLELFARKGIQIAGSRATMYLWIEVPSGETSESFAERLLGRGVVVAPGSHLGKSGEGYVRLALVPSDDECRRAVGILEELL